MKIKAEFCASGRLKSSGSLHAKRKFQGNRYNKLGNANGKTLSMNK